MVTLLLWGEERRVPISVYFLSAMFASSLTLYSRLTYRMSVSYTHLDVYKRQIYWMFSTSENGLFDVKEDVELPNLIGTRWTDVKDDAAYSGFVLEKEEVFDDEAPVGEIVDQNPRAPRQVKEGSRIVAKVSKGVEMVTVPELAGWNKDTAREKLRALNLTLLIKPEETTDVPVDCVVRTDPAAGSVVKAGTTVTLYIRRDSTEVSYVTVPACIGSTSEQQASLRLTQRGLAMRVITVEDASCLLYTSRCV